MKLSTNCNVWDKMIRRPKHFMEQETKALSKSVPRGHPKQALAEHCSSLVISPHLQQVKDIFVEG
eukprot:2784390-Amphidinium_carterae.1